MWYDPIVQLFKIKDLRKKVLFILFVFLIFRVMANIPIPGINVASLQSFFEQFQALGIYNVFTGGALEKLSIVMLGLGPYITATIILQLLTMIFPGLEEMYKEGTEQERKKFEQYGRILTVPLSMLQGFAMLTLFTRQGAIGELDMLSKLTAVFTIAAGSIILMWLGELITEQNLGNGVSLLIFAGIIADFPNNMGQLISNYTPSALPSYILFAGIALVIMAAVVLITEATRKIPVSYAKRVKGRLVYGGASTYLPLSVNPAGVMPIIFALSILTFPPMIANFLSASTGLVGKIAVDINTLFNNTLFYSVLYFVGVVVFTYFYTLITFEPSSIAKNLKKMGGFVPGIRPGESTSKFLNYVLNRILPLGAIFLGIIALMPSFVQIVTHITAFRFLIGGTSVLIIVSVVLETQRAIRAQLEMREYDTF